MQHKELTTAVRKSRFLSPGSLHRTVRHADKERSLDWQHEQRLHVLPLQQLARLRFFWYAKSKRQPRRDASTAGMLKSKLHGKMTIGLGFHVRTLRQRGGNKEWRFMVRAGRTGVASHTGRWHRRRRSSCWSQEMKALAINGSRLLKSAFKRSAA